MPNAKQPLQFKKQDDDDPAVADVADRLNEDEARAKKISGRSRSGEDRKDSAVVSIWSVPAVVAVSVTGHYLIAVAKLVDKRR